MPEFATLPSTLEEYSRAWIEDVIAEEGIRSDEAEIQRVTVTGIEFGHLHVRVFYKGDILPDNFEYTLNNQEDGHLTFISTTGKAYPVWFMVQRDMSHREEGPP